MASIEFFPTLECCIEASAKLEYDRLVSGCLESGMLDAETEALAALLRDFLVSADFLRLRSESEFYLIVGEKVRFTISDDGDTLSCRMDIL
jgi:hypothetical protein